MRLPLTPEQVFWITLVAAALTGWVAGYALVFDWAPAVGRLVRRCWRRWAA